MSDRVTLADVARSAGVSATTASFVLSGRDDMRISARTNERVLGAATRLGYRANRIALSLREGVTNTIGLVSDSIASTQFAGDLVRGGLDAAREHDRLLFIAETGGDPNTEDSLLGGMLDRQVDGLVYAAMYTRTVRLPALLRERPLVLLNCVADGFDGPAVVPDETAAGEAAARVLVDAGHRGGIYAVGGHHITEQTPGGVIAGNERMRGVHRAMRAAGRRLSGVVECAWHTPEHGYDAVRSLLARGKRVRALVCLNDRLAFGAYQALDEAGCAVPDDVSVVSFDDSELATWLRPRLTSVALPHYELGRAAVEALVTGRPAAGVHRVPMPVRARDSVAAVG